MSGPLPRDIWDQSFGEGERRINRRLAGQASTGLIGGVDVMLGLALVVVISGALMAITTAEVAHVVGSLAFGAAFVFITIGRSELFTENFLVPVGAVLAGRGSVPALIRMWALTLVFNLIGLSVFAAILAINGVLPESAHEAAGELGETFAHRGALEALASAVAAGTAMTLYTWMSLAVSSDGARIALAMLIGFVLLLPLLNHAVVAFGEGILALFMGTVDASFWDFVSREAIAIAGNLIGGIGFVTVLRLVQVSGEPHDEEHDARREPRDGRIHVPSSGSDQ